MKYWRGYLVAAILAIFTWALTQFAAAHSQLLDMVYPYMSRLIQSSLAQWSGGLDYCVWQALFLFGIGTSIWAFVDFIRILCNRLMPANGVWAGWRTQDPAPQPVQYAAEVQASDEFNRELRQLDEMRARGVISDEEYLSIRSRMENK